MKQAVGYARRQGTCCEPLENRAYAAKITYGSDATLLNELLGLSNVPLDRQPVGTIGQAVARHGPASVVRNLEQQRADPRRVVTPYLDKQGTLYLRGTFGDDTIDLRNIGNGVIRINYVSFQNFTSPKSELEAQPHPDYTPVPGSSSLGFQTALTANTFELKAANVRRILIDGGVGVDTVRAERLSFVPVAVNVENTAVAQTVAPAGATPSDAIRTGAHGPTSGFEQRALAERDVANSSRATTVFFGDSHAEKFPGVGKAAWRTYFPHALALGMDGNGTRQLLTRIENGLFDTLKPGTLVLSVGANNLNDPSTGGTDRQVADGVLAVVDALRARLPDTRIFMIGLLPRKGAGLNDRVRTINAASTDAAVAHHFTFVDVYDRFAADTALLLTSSSHFTAKGYSVLGSLLSNVLRSD